MSSVADTAALAPVEPALLDVQHLRKSFGGIAAVDGVSFSVARGEMVALIGPNGAGKSTCFNLINGQLQADAGQVLFKQQNLARMSPRAIWRLGISRTFQVAAIFATLSVLENVQMALLSWQRLQYALAIGRLRRQVDEAMLLLTQVGMQQHADRTCGTLAYGDIKRVELALALANSPQLLLMDEPTAGMAPDERQEIMAVIKQLVQQRHMGVLFTEHSMDVVFDHADRVVVLAGGQVIAAGSVDMIAGDEKVQQVYFGRAAVVRGKQAEAPPA